MYNPMGEYTLDFLHIHRHRTYQRLRLRDHKKIHRYSQR